MGGRMKKNKKCIRVSSLSTWMLCLGLLLFFAMLFGLYHVHKNYEKVLSESENYVFAQKDIQDLKNSLDRLTEDARQFILTHDYSFVRLYFQEKREMLKQSAIEKDLNVRLGGVDSTVTLIVDSVYENAFFLYEREIKSICLVCRALGIDENELEEELRDVVLSEVEEGISGIEADQFAYDLLFGHEYSSMKHLVNERLVVAANQIFLHTHQRRINNNRVFHVYIIRQIVLSAVFTALIVTAFILIALIIIRPLNTYVKCIRDNEPLENICAGEELRYLANTYNNMFQMNRTVREELKRQASYDAVSGLRNRMSFEQRCAYYKGVDDAIALLIVDVDKFKDINDSYGHEIGDIALKHVASLLKGMLRKSDKAFRIGGDEFAVIMVGFDESDKKFLSMKVQEMNETLQHPLSKDFPRLSVSAGAAFSSQGYNSEMYSHADSALYITKQNGRCGLTFYESTPEEKHDFS